MTAINVFDNRPPALRVARRLLPWGLGLLLASATLGIFWPTIHCEFLNYDDPRYITENRHVVTGLTWRNVI